MMHRDKEEDEKYALTNKTRSVYCPVDYGRRLRNQNPDQDSTERPVSR